MIDSKEILTLLGIPTEKVYSFDYAEIENNRSIILIDLVDERTHCPKCFSRDLLIHGYYKVSIKNSIVKARKVTVEINMRRYRCKKCGKTFKESFSFYMPYKKISRATEIAIKEDLKNMVSYSYLAKQYNVSTKTIINLFDSIDRQPKTKLTECLCVDEFHFSNHKNKDCQYPFIMSNPFNSKIIDIIESRRYDYLWSYFIKLSYNERSVVKYFISDMNETYRRLKKGFFPNSIHIIDHFHVSKLFTNAIQKIRTKIMKRNEYDSKEYRFLKKYWKLFLCSKTRLKQMRKINKRTGVIYDWEILINEVLEKYPDLKEIYKLKEEFNYLLLPLHLWSETERYVDYFIKKMSHSLIPEIQQVGNTFKNWRLEIINAYAKNATKFCLSNSIAEANNNNIQTLIDIGYGYGNFERLRNRVLYINRNKK